jgi:hypothetical protein
MIQVATGEITMDSFEKYRQLFAEAERLEDPKVEKDIFSIGGRGHYENPKSDLLAFFIDPKEVHRLGLLFLRSLFECMGETSLALTSSVRPRREVVTYNGNKIDLVLESDDWVVVIENKIWHVAVNPFDDYVNYVRHVYREKSVRFVLLCVRDEKRNVRDEKRIDWQVIKWLDFAGSIKSNLGVHARDDSSKWPVLAKEFVLSIENTCGDAAMSEAKFDFVRKNFASVEKILEMRYAYLNYLDKLGRAAIERAEGRDFDVIASGHNDWGYAMVIRFYLGPRFSRERNTNISLLVKKDGSFGISVYVHNLTDGQLEFLRSVFPQKNYKDEAVGEAIRVFVHREDLEFDFLFDEMADVAKRLCDFMALRFDSGGDLSG